MRRRRHPGKLAGWQIDAGLSASAITWFKEVWAAEVERWQRRDPKAKRHVYFWVVGAYFGTTTEEAPLEPQQVKR